MTKEEKIIAYILEKNYFKTSQNVLVAVSGGRDSMALLELLYRHQETLGIKIGIAHVNHHQRSASEIEEAYLKQWGKQHHIPIFVGHYTDVFTEAKARDFRYYFFKKVMKSKGYDTLVTAHHKDDQAETVMMRLMRGGLLRHLGAIRDVQAFGSGYLVRPFLSFLKKDLPEYFHFEDASNRSQKFLRNRIRQHYLLEWEKENPQIKNWLVSYSQEIQDLYHILEYLIDTRQTTELIYFKAQIPPLQKYLLKTYLAQFPDLQLTKVHFEELLSLILSDKEYTLPLKSGYSFKKDKETFVVTKISPETDSTQEGRVLKYQHTLFLDDYLLHFGDVNEQGIPLYHQTDVIIRHRRPGDKIFFGSFSKKIRRLFIDEKIPQTDRQKAWILEQENEIIAVIVSDSIYLRKESKNGIILGKLKLERLESK